MGQMTKSSRILTREGCRERLRRFWERVDRSIEWTLITEPAHQVYFANFYPSPFAFRSQNARTILVLGRDGSAILIADNMLTPYAQESYATEVVTPVWYECVESAQDRGTLLIQSALERLRTCPGTAFAFEASSCPHGLIAGLESARGKLALSDISAMLLELRRRKLPDEVALLRRSMLAAQAGLESAMLRARPGMSELQVYLLVQQAASEFVGEQAIVYGDFVSGPQCAQGGGSPSTRSIESGDLVLLDFSVVLHGYRGDFANTFVCDGVPSPQVTAMYGACEEAMAAGEKSLRAGVSGRAVDLAVRGVFQQHGLIENFPHHAGHGVGLGHPEAPFLVPQSSDTLVAGDVLTLEPGLYIENVGGVRIERNYLITDHGYEVLSHHPLRLEPTRVADE